MSDLRLNFASGDPANPLSYPKSWTLLQRRRMALGYHPARGVPFAETGTCGECVHLVSHTRNKTWFKCDLEPVTFGPGSDVRKSWPACRDFVPTGKDET